MEAFVLLLLIVTWDLPGYQDRCFTTSPKEYGQEGERNMPLGLLQKRKMMMMMMTETLMINCYKFP
jgi:hypothetical protein